MLVPEAGEAQGVNLGKLFTKREHKKILANFDI